MAELGAILTAMATPFDAQGRVDEEGAVRLMHHLVEHGSDGVVVAGTTGESATLTDDEQVRLIELAVSELGGQATVVAGAGSNDTRHAVELTERVTALRPDAILSVCPYYNRPPPRGIVRHYEEVSRATDLPVLVYNIPQRTGIDMPNELLRELAQIEHIDGVKQARYEDLEMIDGMLLYAGNDDTLAPVLDLGGRGGILVSSHFISREMRRMVDEPEHRAELAEVVADVLGALTCAPLTMSVKRGLDLLGLPGGTPRLPLVEADERETEIVRAMLERHGLLQTATA